jgi:hypothetical protein
VECPICKRKENAKGEPFNTKSLASHLGGAHPGGKLNGKRKPSATRGKYTSGRFLANSYVAGPSNRRKDGSLKRILNVRSGMAQVLPFKRGWMIVVEGIANPFMAYQVKMAIQGDEEGES